MYIADELTIRRYVKEVMRRGIPKYMAIEIVESAIESSRGGNIEFYINYAITLTYGLSLNRVKSVDKR